jgi:hypothetical protein
MKIIKQYRQYRDKWWALPLILPLLLLPLARGANTYAELDGSEVSLYYLPLALVQSLMLFFDVAALPGIIIGLLCTVARGMNRGNRLWSFSIFLSRRYCAGAAIGFLCRADSIFTTVT